MSLAIEGTLDTNIILRFLLGDVPEQHEKACRLIESQRILRVSTLTIAEIVFVLEGLGFTRAEIKRNIDALCGYTTLYIVRAVVQPALDLYVGHPALSFMDTCLAFEAKVEHAEPLWTFDQKLAKQAPEAELLS